MRIILTRSGIWALEYNNGQWANAGDIVKDNNDIPAIFHGVVDGHILLSELSDPRGVQGMQRVPAGEFLNKYVPDHEYLGQVGQAGIVRNPPSHDEPKEPDEPSVAEIHRKMTEMRLAKESVAMAAVELNEAYAQFVITNNEFEIPTGKISDAFHRLEDVNQRMGINTELDSIPF